MSTANPQPTCPICGDSIAKAPTPSERWDLQCECDRCGGRFGYSPDLLGNASFEGVRHLVSAWIRRQIESGVQRPIVPPAGATDFTLIGRWLENLKYAGFPETVSQKQDALLQAYADIVKDEIGKVIKPHLYPHLISEIAARNRDEVKALNQLLHQRNYIDFSGGENLTLKANGWNRIEEMGKATSFSDSAFVAMWFNPYTEEYRRAVTKALQHCGYKPLVVDEADFNGFIMDQVLALIRQSRFIIADFTCLPEVQEGQIVKHGVRGGVYWEAGLAFGMNKPVIHTCKDNEDCRRRLHFDVAQYRTLFWRPDELTGDIDDLTKPIANPNFAEKLAQHILGTIGKGNYTE
ncbi:MAG: hypothetical protein HYX79_09065 [Chloroflexi bacterium]|nr:hypothetical protein [Chloroflexota bacterium]